LRISFNWKNTNTSYLTNDFTLRLSVSFVQQRKSKQESTHRQFSSFSDRVVN
jgi:hypothetical protein